MRDRPSQVNPYIEKRNNSRYPQEGSLLSIRDQIKKKYSDTQRRILLYLVSRLDRGSHYFKAKYIAKDLGLSAKEVGTNLRILVDICDELTIVPWSYSNSTTWMVAPRAS